MRLMDESARLGDPARVRPCSSAALPNGPARPLSPVGVDCAELRPSDASSWAGAAGRAGRSAAASAAVRALGVPLDGADSAAVDLLPAREVIEAGAAAG